MDQNEPDIYDFLKVVKEKIFLILLVTALSLSVVVFFTQNQKPMYKATATVNIEPDIFSMFRLSPIYIPTKEFNTEIKLLNSTFFCKTIAEKMNLLSTDVSDEENSKIIERIKPKISGAYVKGTGLVKISAVSTDADHAAELANAAASVYIINGTAGRRKQIKQARNSIEVRIDEAKLNLTESQNKLRVYNRKYKISTLGQHLVSELVDTENKKEELLTRYRERHPEVKKLDAKIKNIEQKVKKLPASDIEFTKLTREVKTNGEILSLLLKRYKHAQMLDSEKTVWATIVSPAVKPQEPISPDKVFNYSAGVILGFFFGILIAMIVQRMDTTVKNIKHVEKYLALPVLGIIPKIITDSKRGPLTKTAFKNRRNIGPERSKLLIYHKDKSLFVEAFHKMRASLNLAHFSKETERGKIIAFTSAGIGEGKSLTAANFALSFAQSGAKTLLIEMNFRHPSLHEMFGQKIDPGISSCLVGIKKWTDVVRETADLMMGDLVVDETMYPQWIDNIKILTSGNVPSINPVSLFSSPLLREMFLEMTKKFDIVVLDCPPALLFADTLLVANLISGAILVCKAGKTKKSFLKSAKDQLSNVKMPVLGVVLNDVTDREVDAAHNYKKSYEYYD
ncbi:GumC family protein [Elusimicrobiota bacterium]